MLIYSKLHSKSFDYLSKFTVVSLHKKEKNVKYHVEKNIYHVTSGSNVTRDVHLCVTVFYQPIENDNIANQIHGFTIDYGKFILKLNRNVKNMFSISFRKHGDEKKENNLLTLIIKM